MYTHSRTQQLCVFNSSPVNLLVFWLQTAVVFVKKKKKRRIHQDTHILEDTKEYHQPTCTFYTLLAFQALEWGNSPNRVLLL